MEKYKVPFEYTTFFVFGLLLRVNYPKRITINEAFEVRKILLDEYLDSGLQNRILNRNKTINNFLKDYSAYIYIENDTIYLKDDVDIKDINILLKDINSNFIIDYSLELFKYLKIKEPVDFIENLNKLEKRIEDAYYSNNLKKVKEYLDVRFNIYNSFSMENEDIIDLISDLQLQDKVEHEQDYILYPINMSNYENSMFSDTEYKLDDMLKTPIQKAIFSDCNLYRSKIRFDIDTRVDDMEELYNNTENDIYNEEYDDNIDYEDYNHNDLSYQSDYESEYDDNELFIQSILSNDYIYENLSRKDIIFALKYIDEINEYEKIYGKNKKLENISKRLKYIIDNKEMDIMSKDSSQIKIVLENYLENDSKAFDQFEEESAYLLYETIKDHSDSLFLQKILFVKAYYDLTYDNELFELFNDYKNNKKYKIIHNYIISDNPSVTIDDNKNEYNKAKMLILK